MRAQVSSGERARSRQSRWRSSRHHGYGHRRCSPRRISDTPFGWCPPKGTQISPAEERKPSRDGAKQPDKCKVGSRTVSAKPNAHWSCSRPEQTKRARGGHARCAGARRHSMRYKTKARPPPRSMRVRCATANHVFLKASSAQRAQPSAGLHLAPQNALRKRPGEHRVDVRYECRPCRRHTRPYDHFEWSISRRPVHSTRKQRVAVGQCAKRE